MPPVWSDGANDGNTVMDEAVRAGYNLGLFPGCMGCEMDKRGMEMEQGTNSTYVDYSPVPPASLRFPSASMPAPARSLHPQ